MSRDSDEDALSWAGDDDATLSAGSARADRRPSAAQADADTAASSQLAPGWTPVGSPGKVEADPTTGSGEGAAVAEPAGGKPQTSSAVLVGFGILGGIYLIYTIGWAVTAGRTTFNSADSLGRFMFLLGLWLAVFVPAGWFALAIGLRGLTTRARLLWLILGAIVLIPLPFLLGVGVSA